MDEQREMMRTKRGMRITARPKRDDSGHIIRGAGVMMILFGIEIDMTADESRQLRDMLQAAELASERDEGDEDAGV